MAVILVGERATYPSALQLLSRALTRSAGALRLVVRQLRHRVPPLGPGPPLTGALIPVPAPVQPLSAKVGRPGGLAQSRKHVGPGSSDVMGRARLSGTDPYGEARVTGEHLDTGSVAMVLARVPQVNPPPRLLGVQGAGTRGPSKHTNSYAGLLEAMEGLDQVRAVVRNDVDGLMQVPTGHGPGYLAVAGQAPRADALDESTQHQDGLGPARGGPLPQLGGDLLAVGGEPAADGAGGGSGNVKGGTTGQLAEFLGQYAGSWSEPILPTSLRVRPPATHPDPRHPNEHASSIHHPDEKTSLTSGTMRPRL